MFVQSKKFYWDLELKCILMEKDILIIDCIFRYVIVYIVY